MTPGKGRGDERRAKPSLEKMEKINEKINWINWFAAMTAGSFTRVPFLVELYRCAR